MNPVEEIKNGITLLQDTGYIRLQKDEAVAILDVGRIGPDYIPGHAHADTLAFEISLFGSRFLVNSGTSVYEHCQNRIFQRSTKAHNTVEIDGENSSEVWHSFRVARRAKPMNLEVEDQGGKGLKVTCAHDGFKRLSGRVIHKRTWNLKNSQLEILDNLKGSFSNAVARFYLHPEVNLLKK